MTHFHNQVKVRKCLSFKNVETHAVPLVKVKFMKHNIIYLEELVVISVNIDANDCVDQVQRPVLVMFFSTEMMHLSIFCPPGGGGRRRAYTGL